MCTFLCVDRIERNIEQISVHFDERNRQQKKMIVKVRKSTECLAWKL